MITQRGIALSAFLFAISAMPLAGCLSAERHPNNGSRSSSDDISRSVVSHQLSNLDDASIVVRERAEEYLIQCGRSILSLVRSRMKRASSEAKVRLRRILVELLRKRVASAAVLGFVGGNGALWKDEFNGITATQLCTQRDIDWIRWFPDCERIAVSTSDDSAVSRTFVVDAKSRRLTSFGLGSRPNLYAIQPIPSPNGEWLVVNCVYRELGEWPKRSVELVEVASGNRLQLGTMDNFGRRTFDTPISAWWTPQGEVFASVDGKKQEYSSKLIRRFPRGKTPETLFSSPLGNRVSEVAICGGKVAYVVSREYTCGKPASIRNGQGVVIWEAQPHERIDHLRWSPDAEALYFFVESQNQGQRRVLYRITGRNRLEVVFKADRSQSPPAFSSALSVWAYGTSEPDGRYSFYVVEGKSMRRVVSGVEICSAPPVWIRGFLLYWKRTWLSNNWEQGSRNSRKSKRLLELWAYSLDDELNFKLTAHPIEDFEWVGERHSQSESPAASPHFAWNIGRKP